MNGLGSHVRSFTQAFLLGTLLTGCGAEQPTDPLVAAPNTSAVHSVLAAGGTIVSGGGRALVTDPDLAEYTAQFAVAAAVAPGGAAHGSASIVFGPDFSAVWGAVPGVQSIHVWGKVTAVEVDAEGHLMLSGTATEVETVPGSQKVVFPNEPFVLVVTGPSTFTFTWCLLPVFDFQVTDGRIASASVGAAVFSLSGATGAPARVSGTGCPRAGGA